MTEHSKHLSPEMAALVEGGEWTRAELLEEQTIAELSIPLPRTEQAVDDELETPETHDCPLDVIDNIEREKAITRGFIAEADRIDASTLERHTSCIQGNGPGRLACARLLELLETEELSIDGNDNI